nr:uncharacterized protein LOC110559729 [Meriones unguiculatus]
MAADAQMLKKKISRTCDEAARTLLSSLLLYVLDRADGPQKAEDRSHRASRPPRLQEVGRSPTRFQLLQAKFMGTGREPHLKKTREVGRLISKDKQGPGRSFVNAAINKLLEKTKEGAGSGGQRPPASEKPRWSPVGGKSTVKNILKKFLAAEEKEAKEKETRDKPPSQRPGATRGLLPRIVGRSSILSKLRERFEQSSCLHSEASLLPLHREGRKSKSLQKKKVHRPQVRVLHMATMATSCTRIPPAQFLACTAEPLPALSIATIVCGPQSWLSHCAKLSHSESRRWPLGETTMSSNSENLGAGGNKTQAPMNGEHKEQLKSSAPQEAALNAGLSGMSSKDQALPGHVPVFSPLGLDSPRGTGSVRKDRTAKPNTQEAAADTQGVKDNMKGPPEISMTVCSSEDEAERTPPGSEREPFFAIPRHLPEQETVTQIPLLAPLAVQAKRRAQPAIKPPQITVQLPIVHEMPASPGPRQWAASLEDMCSEVMRREDVAGDKQAAWSTVNEDRKGPQAPTIGSTPSGMPMRLHPASKCGLQEDQGDRTNVDADASQGSPIPSPSKTFPGGIEKEYSLEDSCDLRSCCGASEQSISDPTGERHLCPESRQTPTPSHGTAGRSYAAVGTCSATGLQEGVSTPGLVTAQGCIRPDSSIASGKNKKFGQEECQGLLSKSAPPPSIAQEDISHDLVNISQLALDKQPMTGVKASGGVTAIGVTGHPVPQPCGTWHPDYKITAWPDGAQDTDLQIMPHTGDSKDAESRKIPQPSGTQDVRQKQMSWASAHKMTRQPHVFQDVEPIVTAHLGGSQEPKQKTPLWPSSAQNADHRTTSQQDSTQDTKQMALWPVGAQDPEPATVSQIGDTQGAGHKTTTWAGGAQTPTLKVTSQPGGAQDTKYKITPQVGNTQDTEHKRAAQAGNAQDGEPRPENSTTPSSGSVGVYNEKVTRKPSSHPSLVSSRSSKQGSGATEGRTSEDTVQSHPLMPAAPAALPGSTADTCLVSKFAPHDSSEPAVRKSSSGTGSGSTAMERDPLHKSRASPGPQRKPAEHLDQSQLPSVGAQALDGKHPGREQRFSGAAHSPAHPTSPAAKRETRQVEQAHGPEPPVPTQKAGHRSGPQAESLRGEAKESLPTEVDMGRLQGHVGSEETGTGHARLHQPGQSGTVLRNADPQASRDLGVKERMPVEENPCQHGDRGQEHLPRPLGRQEKSPSQGGSYQADENLATPGIPRKPCGLAMQKRTQSQAQASPSAPQAWGQPDSTAEGSPILGSQQSPDAQHLLQESQALAGSRTTVHSLETADRSPWLTSNAGGRSHFQPLAQDGPSSAPRAEKDLSDHGHRRTVHFAKYYAQSFSDQKAFDLSFRPTVLRASDTFEPPK